MRRPLTNLESRLVEMWTSGVKTEAIADDLGLTVSAVNEWRVRLGLPPRQPSRLKYSEDQIARLKKLWCEYGLSADMIARRMGPGWTRNTVIGQVQRRGFAKVARQDASAPARAPKAPKVKAAAKCNAPKPGQQGGMAVALGNPFPPCSPEEADKKRAVAAAEGKRAVRGMDAIANDNAVPLLERRFGQCAWPVGTPARPAQQMVCGAPVYESVESCSYCLTHAQRATVRDITQPKPKDALVRAAGRWAA